MQLTPDERAAALRFCQTCEDGQDFDVTPAMMQRLSEHGLVRKLARGRYQQTDTMLAVQAECGHVAGLSERLNALLAALQACVGEAVVDLSGPSGVQLLARRDEALETLRAVERAG